MIIELTTDDPRRGEFAPDGSISKMPDLDVFGNTYRADMATIQWVDATTFVVIPPGKGQLIDEVRTMDTTPARGGFVPRKSSASAAAKDDGDATH